MARRKLRIGIALGAGSARGWGHIGMLRALVEAGIKPDLVCGTSIGSLVGAVYASDHLAELEEWVTALTWRKVAGYFDLSFGGGLLYHRGAEAIEEGRAAAALAIPRIRRELQNLN